MGFYGDDYFTEGILFHSPEAKELKKKIIEIVKEVNGNAKFLERMAQNIKASKPPESKMNMLKSKISALFDVCYVSDVLLKDRTYTVGNTIVYEQYYCLVWLGIKDNVLLRLDQEMAGAGFYRPGMTDIIIDPKKENEMTVKDFKNFIDFCNHYKFIGFTFSTLSRPKSITMHNENTVSKVSRDDFKNKVYPDFEKKYDEVYLIKYNRLWNSITISKR